MGNKGPKPIHYANPIGKNKKGSGETPIYRHNDYNYCPNFCPDGHKFNLIT